MNNEDLKKKIKNKKNSDEREVQLYYKANSISVFLMSLLIIVLAIFSATNNNKAAFNALLAALYFYFGALDIIEVILYKRKITLLIGGICFLIVAISMIVRFFIELY